MASLSMGVGSLIAPYITDRLLAPLTPRTGRYAKALMGFSLTSAAVATAGILAGVDGIAMVIEPSAHSSRNRSMRADVWSGP